MTTDPDLIQRLRARGAIRDGETMYEGHPKLLDLEAADTIERLQAEAAASYNRGLEDAARVADAGAAHAERQSVAAQKNGLPNKWQRWAGRAIASRELASAIRALKTSASGVVEMHTPASPPQGVSNDRPSPSGVVGPDITFSYTNYRGEFSPCRRVRGPFSLRWGTSEYHPEPGWLLTALDLDKGAEREFAVKDMGPEGASGVVAPESQWRDIASADKKGPPIWAVFRNDLHTIREDLERWNGVQVTLRHEGHTPSGYDLGWSIRAPVGHGGFPDEWIAGWMPLPSPPSSLPGEKTS